MFAPSPRKAFSELDPESLRSRDLFDLMISFRPEAHKIIVSQKKRGNCNLSALEVSPNTHENK